MTPLSVLIVADSNRLCAHCRYYNAIYDRLRPVYYIRQVTCSTVQSLTLIGDRTTVNRGYTV